MNLLDENIAASQRQSLKRWRRFQQIGIDIGRKGLDDEEQIIPLLHRLGRVTFFTRDQGFFLRRLCHQSYCIVVLDVAPGDTAQRIRSFLSHPQFKSRAGRMGKVILASSKVFRIWQAGHARQRTISWND